MKFDFHIHEIKFDFKVHGTGNIEIAKGQDILNDFIIKNPDAEFKLTVKFTKDDPADTESYATLDHVWVNGFDLKEKFKHVTYEIDTTKHDVVTNSIPNNLYFGYQGSMQFSIEHENDLLSRAAWKIADKDFSRIKWPLRGQQYREKNFDSVHRDAVYMFTGCHPPNTKLLVDMIDNFKIAELKNPLQDNDRIKIEKWINRSNRVKIKNFAVMNHFTTSTGVTESLSTFLQSADTIFLPEKTYYHNGELLRDKNIKPKDAFDGNFEQGSNVLFEMPSPWYTNEQIKDQIGKARKTGCRIALDLTWLPIYNGLMEIDLDSVDEIFFSMNKCWPLTPLRPAFRWSKKRINDSQTFDYETGIYPKVHVNAFMKLLEKFNFDYVFDTYKLDHAELCRNFDFEPTGILWFVKHNRVKHDDNHYISQHYFLDDFVCVVELLNHKGKYFW
jgi:hypothetical protein